MLSRRNVLQAGIAAMLATSFAFVTGCSNSRRFEFTRLCMGVQTTVTVCAPDLDRAGSAAVPAFDRIEQVEQALSDYRPESGAMRLCRQGEEKVGEWIAVEGDLLQTLEFSQNIAAATDGAFCATIGPAVQLWREARRSGKLPSDAALAEAVRLCRSTNIEVDPANSRVRFLTSNVRFDFGGIGKGFAAHAAVDTLKRRGCSRCMIALAGDIAVGDPPSGASGWRIRVHESLPDLLLANAAVSTSGDTEQFIEIDGEKYSHIVDPRTGLGFPAPRGVLVTVVAGNGAIADALGTALYALPIDRTAALLAQFHAAAIFAIGEPGEDPEFRIIDPHHILRWVEERAAVKPLCPPEIPARHTPTKSCLHADSARRVP